MLSWINIRVFALVQTLVLTGAQYSTETCVEAEHRRKSAELLCQGGYISDVSVQSGIGKCLEKDGRCLGMTPTLLVDQLNCYWRSNCVVNWPSEPIIFTENDRSCIGKPPTFMGVRYKCFKPTNHKEEGDIDDQPPKSLIDVCSDSKSKHSFQKRAAYSNVAGIMRSHELYPWDYSSKPRKCSVKFYGTENLMLFITVQSIDLSEDDRLVIGNGPGKDTNITGNGSYIFSNSPFTSFSFSVGTESNSGKGFLLCFRFTSNTDKLMTNACDSIMTDGIVRNTEPVADDPFALQLHQEAITTTTPAVTTELPTRCKRKKTEKARKKCAARIANRGKNRRKNRGRGNKGRIRKGKRDRRKRRHSIRRNT